MKLIVISGRSGSGKSTALNALEDSGYDCIDNFPVALLQSLVHNTLRNARTSATHLAVCIDARSKDLHLFPEILLSIDRMDVDCQVIYIDASSPTLVKRFSETRRRHPLTNSETDLRQAIDAEAEILEGIADLADLTLDSTRLSAQDLREVMTTRVIEKSRTGINLLFRSFGFKNGVPVDVDIVFDLRCLPNPFWNVELRSFNGTDAQIRDFLDAQDLVNEMFNDVSHYLETWIPQFEANSRVYMTVGLGCTGGQHRSVYFAERLGAHFSGSFENVLVRHRELPNLKA